jgi:hypothetical protein
MSFFSQSFLQLCRLQSGRSATALVHLLAPLAKLVQVRVSIKQTRFGFPQVDHQIVEHPQAFVWLRQPKYHAMHRMEGGILLLVVKVLRGGVAPQHVFQRRLLEIEPLYLIFAHQPSVLCALTATLELV